MASLVHLERYQTERRLDTVRRLLGWSAPSHAGRIQAGASPLSDLAAGEFVLCLLPLVWVGVADLPLLYVTVGGARSPAPAPHPHFILQAAIFAHLCEMFVGVAPCTSLFRHFFVLVKSRKAKDHLGVYYF